MRVLDSPLILECAYFNLNQVFLMGGSHGGFLVTHLAGQYPDQYQVSSPTVPLLSFFSAKKEVLYYHLIFKGVVARNPVTNIARWKTSFK
jgi:hypothetical protein